jgi:hypothetical protein
MNFSGIVCSSIRRTSDSRSDKSTRFFHAELRPALRQSRFGGHLLRMSIGFKEWALVCDALGRGEQSIILRKGGIAEGRAGFRFQHPEFLLFPTLFHEQVRKLRVPEDTPLPLARADGQIEVRYAARVEWTQDVLDWETVRALAPFHCWQESEIEKRFRQDDKQMVSLAFVRVQRLSEPFVFADSPRYGGCRSWVELPDLPTAIKRINVLDETEHRRRELLIRVLQAKLTEISS